MKRGFLLGAVAATGAIMLIPGVAQALGRAGRPIAKAGIKTGAFAYKEFQKAGAEAYEHFEDLVAEFQAEVRAGDEDKDKDTAPPEMWEADVTDINVTGKRNA